MIARSSIVSLIVTILLAGGSAGAQTAAEVPPALRACASIKKNSERLACYDLTIASLSSNTSAEAVFGASVPETQREELTSVSAQVTALHHDASGALVIDLDNGQQWRQISGSNPLLEVGHEVTITRAALNSFRMSTPSGRALKVKRVQ
jgi:hypothetical protein